MKKTILTILLLLVPSICLGASSRILPVSYDESTYNSAGGKDYTSLATWEDATDTDLVTATKGKVLTCDSGIHDDNVYMTGATTNSSYFRVIRGAVGTASPTTGARFVKTVTTNTLGMWTNESYCCFYDVAVKIVATSGNSYTYNFYESGNVGVRFVGCFAYDSVAYGTGSNVGFYLSGSSGTNYAINCAVNNLTGGTGLYEQTAFLIVFGATASGVLYNCTSNNTKNAFWAYRSGGTATAIATNCLALNYTVAFKTYGTVAWTQTTNVISGMSVEADTYHTTTAWQTATDLSATFTDDIDGDTRSNWTVGADDATTVWNDTSSRKMPLGFTESTYGDGTRDYTSLATWEDATDTDLVTANNGQVLSCYADSASYSNIINMAGATTNASYFRVVRAASGQRGTLTGGVRFTSAATTVNSYIICITESYSKVHDLAVQFTTNTTNQRIGFYALTGGWQVFTNCTSIGRGGTNATLAFLAGNVNTSYFINCVAKDSGSTGYAAGFLAGANTNVIVYNCTSLNNKVGFLYFLATSAIAKNCISSGDTTDFSGAWSQTTNTTNDVTFEADGYHLDSSDTGAIGNGTDLSADGAYAFDDDIDGETRSDWDIGSDEYVSTGTSRRRLMIIN